MEKTADKTIDQAIAELYELHRADALRGTDERWMEVHRLCAKFAELVVNERCPSHIFGPLRQQAVEDLRDELFEKFWKRVFKHEGTNMLPLLRRVAANALTSCFRKRRSLLTLTGWAMDNDDDPIEGSWEQTVERQPDGDMFARIRAHLPPFRFLEYQLVREAILVFFLTHQTYPGERFLQAFGVRQAYRAAIYNAAVVDLNHAMKQVISDAN